LSLVICTPIHGFGQTSYWKSILKLQEVLINSSFDHAFLILENESLIQRARNNATTTFLSTEYERMLFIDSDIEFEPEDVLKLWNLDVDVAVGAYPMKRIDVPTCGWVDGKLIDLDKMDGPTPVDYAGTGFMMIKRDVFLKFHQEYEDRFHNEGKPGENVLSQRVSFNYFDTRVDDGCFLSEDYSFCADFRKIGGEIILEPSIRLKHYGTYGFGE